MLLTHAVSVPVLLPPTPITRHFPLSNARPALADSTNVNSWSNGSDAGCSKGLGFPTSSARTGCTPESFIGPIHPRHHHLPTTSSLFLVTYKAPPTVSISLSEACSQSIPAERSRAQGSGPDLPDVQSVVPFPSAPLNGDVDAVMLDGTDASRSSAQGPRKRRSAHSSAFSSQNSPGKDVKQKRPRKSRQQVVELWWLGVVRRSILRCIENRSSIEELESDRPSSDFDAMDRALVEKIQKRLVENGCVDGRALPNVSPRISSPSVSMPSLSLSVPSKKTLPISAPSILTAELNAKGSSTTIHGTTTASKASASVSLSIPSRSSIPSSASAPYRRHVRFDVPQQPRQPDSSIHRRSPSPPARTGAVSANAQTLALTMPQLVASLTLAYHERNGLRVRGRSDKVRDCGKNAGRSPPSSSCQAVPCSDGDLICDKERRVRSTTRSAKLARVPERKSPLSRVAYAES